MLAIDTEGFHLHIKPVSAQFEEPGGAYLEWIDVQITVTEPDIRAKGSWSVMPEELRQFRQEIQIMQTGLQPGQSARLASVECGFDLTLRMLNRGAITGDWCFQPKPADGARITGQCGLDQTFLPEILRGIDALLSFCKSKRV